MPKEKNYTKFHQRNNYFIFTNLVLLVLIQDRETNRGACYMFNLVKFQMRSLTFRFVILETSICSKTYLLTIKYRNIPHTIN